MARIAESGQPGALLTKLLDDFAGRKDVIVVPVRAPAVPLAIEVASGLGTALGTLMFSGLDDESPFELSGEPGPSASKPEPDGEAVLLKLDEATVILIDDGFGPLDELLVAAVAIRRMEPAYLIAASPIAPSDLPVAALRLFDRVVALSMADAPPRELFAEDDDPTPPRERRALPRLPARRRRPAWVC